MVKNETNENKQSTTTQKLLHLCHFGGMTMEISFSCLRSKSLWISFAQLRAKLKESSYYPLPYPLLSSSPPMFLFSQFSIVDHLLLARDQCLHPNWMDHTKPHSVQTSPVICRHCAVTQSPKTRHLG